LYLCEEEVQTLVVLLITGQGILSKRDALVLLGVRLLFIALIFMLSINLCISLSTISSCFCIRWYVFLLNWFFLHPAILVEARLLGHGFKEPPLRLHRLRLYIILEKSYSVDNNCKKGKKCYKC
jgi:hypothetical protein